MLLNSPVLQKWYTLLGKDFEQAAYASHQGLPTTAQDQSQCHGLTVPGTWYTQVNQHLNLD